MECRQQLEADACVRGASTGRGSDKLQIEDCESLAAWSVARAVHVDIPNGILRPSQASSTLSGRSAEIVVWSRWWDM